MRTGGGPWGEGGSGQLLGCFETDIGYVNKLICRGVGA